MPLIIPVITMTSDEGSLYARACQSGSGTRSVGKVGVT